jgi:hypothetical protein
MQVQILSKTASEFTTSDGTLLKGWNLEILRDTKPKKTVANYWIPQEKIKELGFNDKMVSNPFDPEGDIVIVNATFDEKPGFGGKPGKIVPTSFTM